MLHPALYRLDFRNNLTGSLDKLLFSDFIPHEFVPIVLHIPPQPIFVPRREQ
jgi:hypothetical protein